MKKAIRTLALTSFFTLLFSLNAVFSQPEPGNQSNGNNVGGAPIAGSGVPVGGGEFFLLALAALYGGRKVYHIKYAQLKQY